MTKIIAILIIAGVLYGGWHLFFYWERVKYEEQAAARQSEVQQVTPEQLSGMSAQLEPSLKEAQKLGVAAMRSWLRTYGPLIHDPRKAWIELDYCMALARENPTEARRVFQEVKDRTPATSPVWPRIQSLQKTYE